MMNKSVTVAIVLLLAAAALPGQTAGGQQPGADPKPAAAGAGGATGEPGAASPAAGPYRYFDLKLGPKTWGAKAEAKLGFRFFDGVDTVLWGRLDAAYKFSNYYRNADLSLYRQDLNPGSGDPALQKFIGLWGLGVQQGLHFNPATDRDDLTLLLAYRGAGSWPSAFTPANNLLANGSEPGRGSLVMHSLQLDLQYDGLGFNKASKVPSGWWADISAELAPAGISIPASVAWAQFDATARGFLPLYEQTTAEGWNLISLYLAGQLAVDYIAGLGSDATKGVPYAVSQRFGGRSYQDGLGGTVRGLGDGWADGSFKAAGNLELRCNFPAMFRDDILFGALAFVDAGYYALPPGAPAGSALASGFLASTGLGLFLDLFDYGYVAVYSSYVLNSANARNNRWEIYSFEFGLHF